MVAGDTWHSYTVTEAEKKKSSCFSGQINTIPMSNVCLCVTVSKRDTDVLNYRLKLSFGL